MSNEEGNYSHESASFLVRRSRIKADGWILNTGLKYKLELALSNRDVAGGHSPEFRNTANIVLDAFIRWRFYKNLSIQFGQAKLPGNRERVISSGNLQFVDRSLLNSRFTLDRDVGIQLRNHHFLFNRLLIREIIAFGQGEGRNVTSGFHGGFDYTARIELLPFGEFAGKGDYVGAAIRREEKVKLSVAVTYDYNANAVRERGQLGTFIINETGSYIGKDLKSIHADMMLKYRGWSMMAEYAHREVSGEPVVFDEDMTEIGTYYTGEAINVQVGAFFTDTWEAAIRYTEVFPDVLVAENETQYTFGLSKYVVGHKLKIQTDFTYVDKDISHDILLWRLQVEVHL